jgi:hypothetical protein
MPAKIIFANGNSIDVSEDPDQVYGRLNEAGGLPARFEIPHGDGTKAVYVNPQQVAYFEDMPESVYERRGLSSVPTDS